MREWTSTSDLVDHHGDALEVAVANGWAVLVLHVAVRDTATLAGLPIGVPA